MSDQPSKKRPFTSGTQAQQRKRAKTFDARHIATESSSPALKDGVVDVHTFVNSRKYEIDALKNAMKRSRTAGAQRAFQSLPRSMRRRAASHDVKKMPKRLWERAKHEMTEDNTQDTKGKNGGKGPKGKKRLRSLIAKRLYNIGKKLASAPQPDEDYDENVRVPELKTVKVRVGTKYHKRQVAKTWLPSHMYTSKRAHMTQLHEYSIPIKPTEKSYRPTHRASLQKGCIVFDQSFYSVFFLHGTEESLKKVLTGVCEPGTGVYKNRYAVGGKVWEGWVYHANLYPKRPIGPATILWRPSDDNAKRSLMIRIHPAAFRELWDVVAELVKQTTDVRMEDARFAIGSLDIVGPGGTEALKAVLQLASASNTSDAAKIWEKFNSATDVKSLPLGAALDLQVNDPRLTFPPRAPNQAERVGTTKVGRLTDVLASWPQQMSGCRWSLFDRTTWRPKLATESKLNKRRTAAGPGVPLVATSDDPSISIILLRTSTPVSAWTVLAPWDVITHLFRCLMHYPAVRFGGLENYHQLTFERSTLNFPNDFPGTEAGWKCEEDAGKKRKEDYEKKPKAKRVSFEKVFESCEGAERGEVGDPMVCDWKVLRGAKSDEDAMEVDGDDNIDEKQWLLSPALSRKLVTSAGEEGVDMGNALIPVRLHLQHRGSPAARARIYSIPKADLPIWTALASRTNTAKPKAGTPEYPACPTKEHLIGFVSTGNFSLKEGKGVGVGAVAYGKVANEVQRDGKQKDKAWGWCIVRDVGTDVGRLARWDVVE
ncbi:Ribonucleases P/MRP protein subunit pop1 [Saitoella coloradoensis]